MTPLEAARIALIETLGGPQWIDDVFAGKVARAAITAFLDAVDVGALIRPALEAPVSDDEGVMPTLAECMADQYSGENKTQTTMRFALSAVITALRALAEKSPEEKA